MSRPIYENAETLDAEGKLSNLIMDAWGCKAVKLGRKYKVDFALTRKGTIKAWAELKKRSFEKSRYDEYMLSLDKYMTACALSKDTNVPCFLVVEFEDDVVYADLAEVEYRLGMGGRKDRGDPEDYEPCCWMPLSQFKSLLQRKGQ